MTFGTFSVVIDGEQIGGLPETAARLTVDANTGTLKDADGDKFKFPRPPASVALPYTLTLDTDVASGAGVNSDAIGYTVRVTTSGGGVVNSTFAARPAGTVVALTDLTETVVIPINETIAARDEAVAAAAAAVAVGSTNDSIIASRVNDGASATRAALSATFVGTVASASVADGTTNDRAAIATADTSAAAFGAEVLLKKGTHRVSSNLTIASPVRFQPGAIIKPDSGVTITLAGGLAGPLAQVFDQSAGGKVVPKKVAEWHPAWWGPVNTADDSATWVAMLAARTTSAERQTIRLPQGTSRLWNITLTNVHIVGQGHAPIVKPALAAVVPGGYVVKLDTLTTIDGGEWGSDTAAGFDIFYYVGIRCWVNNAYIKPNGAGTIGIHAVPPSGSITPRGANLVIYGDDSAGSIGLKMESADAEFTNVWIAHTDTGIQDGSSATFLGCHIWENVTGVKAADASRFIGCYIENNTGWGLDGNGADDLAVSDTRFWHNGKSVGGTGGMRLVGSGVFCQDARIDAIFDDNIGDNLLIDDADRITANITVTSTSFKGGGAALSNYGVRITSTSTRADVKVRGKEQSVLTALVSNATSDARIDLGRREASTTGAVSLGPSSTALTNILSIPVNAGQKWKVTGWAVVDGAQAADCKLRVQATSSTGASGHFGISSSISTSTASTTASSANPVSAAVVAASGGGTLSCGLVGVGSLQRIGIDAFVVAGSADGTIDLQVGPLASDATIVTVSFATLTAERVA